MNYLILILWGHWLMKGHLTHSFYGYRLWQEMVLIEICTHFHCLVSAIGKHWCVYWCYPSENQNEQGAHWSPLFVAKMSKTDEIALKAIHKTKGCAVILTQTASKRHYEFITRRRMTESEGERWTKQQYRKAVWCLSPPDRYLIALFKLPFHQVFSHTQKIYVQAVNGLVMCLTHPSLVVRFQLENFLSKGSKTYTKKPLVETYDLRAKRLKGSV